MDGWFRLEFSSGIGWSELKTEDDGVLADWSLGLESNWSQIGAFEFDGVQLGRSSSVRIGNSAQQQTATTTAAEQQTDNNNKMTKFKLTAAASTVPSVQRSNKQQTEYRAATTGSAAELATSGTVCPDGRAAAAERVQGVWVESWNWTIGAASDGSGVGAGLGSSSSNWRRKVELELFKYR